MNHISMYLELEMKVVIVVTIPHFRTNQIHDIWQFGIVIFVCLTGCLPWQKAALDDPRYNRLNVFASWFLYVDVKTF